MAQSQTSPELKDANNEEGIGEKFNSLLKASSTLGTHFRFTIEKRWDDSKNVTIPSYFVLNLESVAENLSKIPFFERLQIHQPFLQNDSSMKTTAVSCDSRRTKDSIAQCLENAHISNDLNSLSLSENNAKNHIQVGRDENTNTNENENITGTLNESIPTKSPVANESQESLDDWLDSVLDS